MASVYDQNTGQPLTRSVAGRIAGTAWFPWVLALGVWCLVSLATVEGLRRWHERERGVLEDQAGAMVHALASSLWTMSGRVQRTDGMLERVFGEIMDHSTVTGIALTDPYNQCVAQVGMPETWLPTDFAEAQGTHYFTDSLLIWDTVDVGRYRPGHMHAEEITGIEHTPENVMRLFVCMPLDKLHRRWRRDHLVVVCLCILALGMAVGMAAAWTLARRSAAYSARLVMAEKEALALAEVNLVAAGLAHEIKNPLGVVRGTAQRLVCRTPADSDDREALGVIMGEIDRITSRVNELFAFAKPTAPTLAPVILRQALTDLGNLMEEELADAGMSLDCSGIPVGTRIMADPELLRRLLFNLLHNAIRYAPGSGAVEVSLSCDRKGYGVLSVRDHGPGVPPDLQDKVFSAYFTTRAEGTGLGLAVVRRITSAHGWDVACRDASGGGALFEVRGVQLIPG